MKNKIWFSAVVVMAAIIYAPHALAGSATVTWNANTESDLAGYKIYYGTSPRTGTDPKSCGLCGYNTSVNVGNVTSYNFSNLTGSQTYYFSVTAYDTSNNESAFSSEVSKQIITLPQISNLVGSNTTATTTNISWSTNVLTNGQVFYGLTSAYGSSSSLLDSSPMAMSHSVTLTGLSPSTLYHFKVTSIDSLSNSTSSPDFTFTTLALPAVPAPTISSFTASPSSITQGQQVTLSFAVSGSTTALSIDNGIGSVLGQSSKSVSPSQTTTYTLTAANSGGTATKSVTVTVSAQGSPAPTTTAPTITSFTAGSSSITAGQLVSLSWTVTGTPAPAVTIDNSLGSQAGSSVSVSPQTTTTYTLTAANSAGMATAQVTVNVTAAVVTPPSSGGGGGGGGSPSAPSSGGGGGGGSSGTPSSTSPGTTVYIPPTALATSNSASPSSAQTPTNPSALSLVNDNGTFYLIINNTLHGITNPGMLSSYGFSFSQAKPATAQDLALPKGNLLTPGNGALVKSAQDQTVYLVSNQQRYAFTSASVFLGLGFKFSSVLVVTNPELQELPRAADINNGSSQHLPGTDINKNGTIYWVGPDNQLHGYSSLTVYNSWHIANDFSTVVPANSSDLSLPIGTMEGERVVG